MNFLELSDCCRANMDSIVIIPSAFEKDEVTEKGGPLTEKLTLGKSGKSVQSPFFLYFSHTPVKKEVINNLPSLIKVIIERNIPIFGDQHTYGLITGNLVAEAGGVEEADEEVIDAVEYLEEDELKELFVSQLTPDRRGIDIDLLTRNLGIELKLGFDREDSVPPEKGIPSVRHLDIKGLDELRNYIHLLKEATEYNYPIFVSVRGDSVYDVCFEAVEGMADTVILRCSNPVVEIPGAIDAFKDSNAEKKGVKLFVVAPVRDAEDVLKLRALGADAVGFDICEFVQNVKDKEGLVDYLNTLEEELRRKMLFYGVNELSSLGEDGLRALDYNTAAISGLKLIGYDRKLPMWLH